MRRATVESSARAVVLTRSWALPKLIVPPETVVSPALLRIGQDSPVIANASKVDVPPTTIPSQGTLSPVGTFTILPTGTDAIGTITNLFVVLSFTLARSGCHLAMEERAFHAQEELIDLSHSDRLKRNATAAASE
jgi:hypothetical protein